MSNIPTGLKIKCKKNQSEIDYLIQSQDDYNNLDPTLKTHIDNFYAEMNGF